MRWGLTGGIGSGTSAAARRFEELGVAVISADQVGHEVLRLPEIQHEILEAFSPKILDANGEINRTRLGEIIFGSEQARKKLNRIVHSPLLDRVMALARAAETQTGIVIVDAALIYEWSMQDFFHKIIVVDASLETRVQRIMDRDKLTRVQALLRIHAQTRLEAKVERADYTIANDGTLEELYRQADEIWRGMRADK
jgi:dephospho-CoA kinase